MRRLFSLSATALSALALSATASAQSGLLGTKLNGPVPVSTGGSTGVGVGALFQMLLALGVVAVLLKVVLPKVAAKFSGRFRSKSTPGILVEETVQVPGGSLSLVTSRGRTFLIGSTPTSVQNLAELTQVPEIDPFEVELLQAAPYDPATAEITDHTGQELDALAQLTRLAQITDRLTPNPDLSSQMASNQRPEVRDEVYGVR